MFSRRYRPLLVAPARLARLRQLHVQPQKPSPQLVTLLESYTGLEPRPIPLSTLFSFSQPTAPEDALASASYVRSEIPRRVARVIRNFDRLPFICGTNPFIARVHSLYKSSFQDLCKVPEITNQQQSAEFAAHLEAHVEMHSNDIPTLSKGSVCSPPKNTIRNYHSIAVGAFTVPSRNTLPT